MEDHHPASTANSRAMALRHLSIMDSREATVSRRHSRVDTIVHLLDRRAMGVHRRREGSTEVGHRGTRRSEVVGLVD